MLLSIAKLQNLKAIHNRVLFLVPCYYVVINRKTIKFESNSQPPSYRQYSSCPCYQSQKYKIWKQFTTVSYLERNATLLLSIAKLQNLKAIHNRQLHKNKGGKVVINRKTTKFESNSQQKGLYVKHFTSCYQSQNYKIWKQFTTSVTCAVRASSLLSIAKLQNLKAIHNISSTKLPIELVVINRKTTKFESNSQLIYIRYFSRVGCYQSQNYKIWKQFTTLTFSKAGDSQLLSIAKLQNLKVIHNLWVAVKVFSSVVINRKTTKFESNSQLNSLVKDFW